MASCNASLWTFVVTFLNVLVLLQSAACTHAADLAWVFPHLPLPSSLVTPSGCERLGRLSHIHCSTRARFHHAEALSMSGRKGGGRRILRVTLDEMHEGMELEGIIRSVKDYGAFVDVGSTTDGLLHISNMLPIHRQFIGNTQVVTASEGEQILVEVLNVDLRNRKFALREVQLSWQVPKKKSSADKKKTAKAHLDVEQTEALYAGVLTGDEDEVEAAEAAEAAARKEKKRRQRMEKWEKQMQNRGFFQQPKPGTVNSVTEYGAFVDCGAPVDGLLHVSEMVGRAVSRGGKVLLREGDRVHVRIAAVDAEGGKVALTQKAAAEEEAEAAEDAAALAALAKRRAEEEAEEAEGAPRSAFAKAFHRAVNQQPPQ